MTEPTLYQLKVELCDCKLCDLIRSLLVPVKQCEHGSISEHIICYEAEPGWFEVGGSCPGAGIGDTAPAMPVVVNPEAIGDPDQTPIVEFEIGDTDGG